MPRMPRRPWSLRPGTSILRQKGDEGTGPSISFQVPNDGDTLTVIIKRNASYEKGMYGLSVHDTRSCSQQRFWPPKTVPFGVA